MKLPEPAAWVYKTDFGRLMFSSSPTVPPWSFPVFSEGQFREALAQHETVMRHVLDVLGPQAPKCCGCEYEWNEALTTLKEALK